MKKTVVLALALVLSAVACAPSRSTSQVAAANVVAEAQYALEAQLGDSGVSAVEVFTVASDGAKTAVSASLLCQVAQVDGMLPWSVCADSAYQVQIDSPGQHGDGYVATLTLLKQPQAMARLFSCTVDGTALTCIQTGTAQSHSNAHTSVGVSN